MNITISINRRTATTVGAAVIVAGLLGACSSSSGTSQSQGQKITESYAKQLTNAEPYPLAQMKDSDERANLRERLLRFNNPNKIGYLYELSQTGQVVAFYTVKGKVSSTGSQITPSQNINDAGGTGVSVTESMGDDGSYGPEEGGIFAFTTSGVMIEWNGLFQYSDAPLNLTSKPLVTINGDAKPSSNAGQLK